MKKALAIILAASMVLSMAACGTKNGNENVEGTPTMTPTTAPTEAPAGPVVIAPEVVENTSGSTLWNSFLTTMTEKPETTPEEMANILVTNPVIQFFGGAVPVEAGFLSGFDTEISGFESAAMFAPMMGSIAFVGYVFDLAEDADVNAFMEILKNNANPRWNICVSADYTQVGAYGNTVYFLMYPAEMDAAGEGSAEGNGTVTEADVYYPDVNDDTWGATLWNSFENAMYANPEASVVDVAFTLSMDESIQFMSGSAEMMPGYLAGFSQEITEFKSAAMFGPMMGSIAFVGYVFELEEGADREAFMNMLQETSDPRWNICVEAEQTVIGAFNNIVFFLMCPNSNAGE